MAIEKELQDRLLIDYRTKLEELIGANWLFSQLPIEISCKRESSFDPILVPNGQICFVGLDDQIISLYGRGMTTREIQGRLENIYGIDVFLILISMIINAVTDGVKFGKTAILKLLVLKRARMNE